MSIAGIVQESWSRPVYNGTAVTRETLLTLLNIAIWAPNHHLREPWVFTWMEGLETGTEKQKEHPAESPILAPGYLAVSMKIRTKPKELAEDEAAVWCLIQNLRILAKEQGIGIHIQQPETAFEAGCEELWRANSGEQIVAILGIGYTDTRLQPNENAAKIIRERRTVRQFTSATLDDETVRGLLEESLPELGLQPKSWRVIEAGSEEERSRWADLMMGFAKDMLTYKLMPGKVKNIFWKRTYDIPFNLVFVLKHQPEQPGEPKGSAHFGEVCSVMHIIQLLAWEKGIGMTWSSSDVIEDMAFRKGLDIKPDERIIGILHMGYTAKIPKGKERTPAENKIRWV
ncbi:nitroreductase family protein [Paenibacillus xylanivorans]|uniref:Nitroreductase domain-containing protein n=1 Tax=Paenibacillus xylanivorans TaxID=1705561 RepID=A0A0N0C4W5_9BACL|nr:nitroreductase family protein [Paenibacillus xylanivorans]KOY16394.1 hypothetical protein AMS66_11030 [Paenibacillus xylanivorans]